MSRTSAAAPVATAVVLAAGLGVRLRPRTETVPKGLLEVGGATLLARSLAALGAHGVTRAVIVTGHLGERVRAALGARCAGVALEYVENARYASTGSMASLAAARAAIAGAPAILLLESDLLYDPAALADLAAAPQPDVLLAAEPTGHDDVLLCADARGRLVKLGKHLPAADARTAVGCLVGISRLSARFLERLFAAAAAEPAWSARHYEECIADAASAEQPVHVALARGLVWTEVDTEEDLRRACAVVLPALRAGEPRPVRREILLNPGPATTTDSVKYAQVVPDICPREQDFAAIVASIADDLTRLACKPADVQDHVTVLFGGSGTAGVEAVVASVAPPDGRLLVVNNGAYGERMVQMARAYGIDVVDLRQDGTRPADPAALEAALAREPGVSCVLAVHHETTTGVLNPVAELGAIAAARGCLFAVDAISSFGGVPFDVRSCRMDFMIGVSNKCLQAMAGVVFVTCSRAALARIEAWPRRCLYLSLHDQFAFFERHRQTRFTPPVQTIYALRRALDELLAEGPAARHARYADNWRVLRRGMQRLGFAPLTEEAHESRILTTFRYPTFPSGGAFDFDRMHDALRARGFTVYPGKIAGADTFRLANMGAIDARDIERFLAALADVVAGMTEGADA
jgi:2-aminoethylphosphonate-pyruvate transaminase